MKIFASMVFLIGMSLTVTSHSQTTAESKIDPFGMRDQQNVGRLLLVAFSDGTINSLNGSASPTAYRKRRNYEVSTWSERVSNQLAEDYALEKITEWPMTELGSHCVVYKIAENIKMADMLERLSKDNRVDIVQSMNTFNTKAHLSNDPYLKLQTNLQQMQVNLAHEKATGQNITIGMIDTGVDMNHPDLTDQISDYKNLAEDISTSFSTDKHGTAIAGVMVARKDNAKGIMGIAPNAKLIALKACWPDKPDSLEAVCNSYTLAMALNNAIKADVDILNMSLSGPKDPLLSLLLKKAVEKGMIVVAADSGTGENFPASLKDVISVQSLKDAALPSLSESGSISAPGEKVLTTLPYGTYDFISGSSIATAEISGIVALLLEIKPDLSVDQVNALLQKSKIASKGGFLSGVDANVALKSLCESNPCPKDVLSFAQLHPY